MKILLYSSYFIPYISGMTVYAKRILTELAKRHKVTVLTFRFNNNLKQSETTDGIHIMRIPYVFRMSKGFISLQSLLYFFNTSKKTDVLFLNIPNAEGLPLAILAKIFRKRLIAIYYCDVMLGNSVSAKFIELVLNSAVYLQLQLSERIIMLPGYKDHSKLAKKFVNKITVIPPPIKKLQVNNEKLQDFRRIKGKNIWIGFVGRIAREKGIEYLIEAMEYILRNGIKVSLLLVGPSGKEVSGEEAYTTYIKHLLKKKNIPHKLLGFLAENDLGAFYSVIDLLVLPSINKTEAFGMVQVEAMLSGVPVIASDLPGVREPITRTGMGEIVNPKDSRDLAEKIIAVLKNKKKYLRHKVNIEKIYSYSKSIHAFEQIIVGYE